jgi:glucose dehydrogenase
VFGGIGHRFFALDAPSGEELWSVMLGAPIAAAPITYEVLGRQHVTIAAARTIFTFALDE